MMYQPREMVFEFAFHTPHKLIRETIRTNRLQVQSAPKRTR
jgi:hypothetical protein